MAKLQLAALFMLLLLVFLAYIWYESWVQDRQGLVVLASGNDKPGKYITYVTKDQFRNEQSRQKMKRWPIKSSLRSTPPRTT